MTELNWTDLLKIFKVISLISLLLVHTILQGTQILPAEASLSP